VSEVRSIFEPGTPEFGLFLAQGNVTEFLRFATEEGIRQFVAEFPEYRLKTLAMTSESVLDAAKFSGMMRILFDMAARQKFEFLAGLKQIKVIDYGKYTFEALDADSLMKLLYAMIRYNQSQSQPYER